MKKTVASALSIVTTLPSDKKEQESSEDSRNKDIL